MKNGKVGFGLIGLGSISGAHQSGLTRPDGRGRLVAVCDVNAETANRVAAATGARAYTDYHALLADPEVEAVDIPLPHHLHVPVATAALEAGKHVLLEKPMALNVAECDRLIALADERKLTLGVSENTPFVAAYVAVEKMLRAGTLGTPRLVRTLIYGSEVHRLEDVSNWKGRIAGTVGGAIFDAGPHTFYLLKWLFGEVASVQAVANKLVAVSEVEDNAVVAGRLKSGALFTTEFTFTAEIPWGERLEIYGSEGAVVVDQLLDPPAIHYRGRADFTGVPLAGVAYLPDRTEHDTSGWKFRSIADGVAAFAAAVAEGKPAPVSPLDAGYAIKVVEAAYRSVAEGGIAVRV